MTSGLGAAPAIEEAVSGTELMRCLEVITPLWTDHHLAELFVVVKLHGHELHGDGEALLVTKHEAERKLRTAVVPLGSVDASQANAWRFALNGERVPMSYGATMRGGLHLPMDLAGLGGQLDLIGSFFVRNGLTDKLAVIALQALVTLDLEREALLESTAPETRTQVSEVIPRASTAGHEAAVYILSRGQWVGMGWCGSGNGGFHPPFKAEDD